MDKGRLLLSLAAVAFAMSATAQYLGPYQFRHLNHLRAARFDAPLYQKSVDFHTSVRPFNLRQLDTMIPGPDLPRAPDKSWLARKWAYENLLEIEHEDYAFTFNPIVNLQWGHSQGEGRYRYLNTRGFMIEGRIGKDLTFYSSFLENQGRFASYFTDRVQLRQVVPGQGTATRGFGTGGFDFGLPTGEVSYNPSPFFSFTAGQGRNFFGEGYRSMMLSDAATPYPFFRVETEFWRIKYVNLWAQHYDHRPEARRPGSDAIFSKKFFSAHYLSFNVNSRLNFSFFESIVFGDTAQQRGLDASFFNPVIMYRPVEFMVGSGVGRALMALGSSYKLTDGLMAYGQFSLDEFSVADFFAGEGSWKNKYGYQLGLKYHDAFGLDGFFARLEYNAARPYTYSHRQVLTNYAHYGTSLAHPWGGNFQEWVLQLIYQKTRWEYDLQLHAGRIGLDSPGSNWGTDVYKPYGDRERDLGNVIGQGIRGTLLYGQARVAYLVNTQTGLKLEAALRFRQMTAPNAAPDVATTPMSLGENSWFILGLRTELFNRYYEY